MEYISSELKNLKKMIKILYNNSQIFIKNSFITIIILLYIFFYIYIHYLKNLNDKNIITIIPKIIDSREIQNNFTNHIKVALCTMGKKENLYIKEFVDYYIKLGIDHIFIYDDNDPHTEKMSDIINDKYKDIVTIYENIKDTIKDQPIAFTTCYNNNKYKFDWFIMFDMDEYLYIINDTLKNYLSNNIFDKCDFIKINWAFPKDNNLVYYDPRPLFERFKGPYIKSGYVKSIIRGNILQLQYWVHSPIVSPKRNITCNNEGKQIFYNNMNIENLPINTEKAFIIHYRFKSTEEFINKYKRGYSNWFGSKIGDFLKIKIEEYFQENDITLEKIEYIERELKVNLSHYKLKINKRN